LGNDCGTAGEFALHFFLILANNRLCIILFIISFWGRALRMGGWLYREEEEAELLRGRIWEKRLLRNM
jgi:hypothetical protein